MAKMKVVTENQKPDVVNTLTNQFNNKFQNSNAVKMINTISMYGWDRFISTQQSEWKTV